MKSFSDNIPDISKKELEKHFDDIKQLLVDQAENEKKAYKRLVWNSFLLLVNLATTVLVVWVLVGGL